MARTHRTDKMWVPHTPVLRVGVWRAAHRCEKKHLGRPSIRAKATLANEAPGTSPCTHTAGWHFKIQDLFW